MYPISLVPLCSHPAEVLRKIIRLPYCIRTGIHLKYDRNSVKYGKSGNFARDEYHSIIDRIIPAIYDRNRQSASEKLHAPTCPNGVFIKTTRKFSVGQEVAMTIRFPSTGESRMVTGEVARVTPEGVGIDIKVFFKD